MISTGIQVPKYIHEQLSPKQWQQQKRDHRRSISELIDDYLEKRSHQQKDPVLDFLFEYYAFRPSYLKRWSPGFRTLLIGGSSHDWMFDEMETIGENCFLDIQHFDTDRISAIKWILNVLEQSLERKPSFGCFGMHEWAMVYKADHVRHDYLSLRMEKDELAEFVESRPLVCTHFDAFRFFTDEAKPQNKFELNRDKFAEMEQPGCLHTNMDLYKWAFKMYPWISSSTIRQAFELAVDTRVMDMKASPYDLRDRGLEPIKIETDKGRQEYMEKQMSIYERSQPIRKQLIREYNYLLKALCD
ncbi:3-methyladenine DNA glycosylase [Aliifodinibius salipaludis]|uniref:3-methyladenine DNA glycosylase n=1 Tax=Fodinibius salipaludis TaxID=2032627 RepID=A0A2A2G9P1_9BACT|nr:3-methyladenine DNA glycosylase [Aliifodinibius salipaludis]PAU93575.1 3-methyladenine DNA glycosylase [Aliifodinibius salipaludis]